MNRKIIISIHPHLVEDILAGRKRYEFRRRRVPHVDVLFLYATKPISKVLGLAHVADVITGSRAELLRAAAGKTSDDMEAIRRYLDGAEAPTMIRLVRPRRFRRPVPLHELGVARAPQSWQYVPRRA